MFKQRLWKAQIEWEGGGEGHLRGDQGGWHGLGCFQATASAFICNTNAALETESPGQGAGEKLRGMIIKTLRGVLFANLIAFEKLTFAIKFPSIGLITNYLG